MADTKISALGALTGIAGGDKVGVADASDLTVSKSATFTEMALFFWNAIVAAAGSASANSWPKLTSGTLLTTAEAGAIERDTNCFYATTDAGNRGVVPVEHWIRCDSVRTLPSNTNLNAIFNSPTNGRITLETGLYYFEALLYITGLSATSGNALINWLGAGTATVAAWLWDTIGRDVSTPTTIGTALQVSSITNASAASIVTAGTGTGLVVRSHGTFEVTVAGTLIPSIDLVTASAGSVAIGSYFRCRRIGSTTMVSVGQWD
jgi:hypothetical protein